MPLMKNNGGGGGGVAVVAVMVVVLFASHAFAEDKHEYPLPVRTVRLSTPLHLEPEGKPNITTLIPISDEPGQDPWKLEMTKALNGILDVQLNKMKTAIAEIPKKFPESLPEMRKGEIMRACNKTRDTTLAHLQVAIEMLEKGDPNHSLPKRLHAAQRVQKGCLYKVEHFHVDAPEIKALAVEYDEATKDAVAVSDSRTKKPSQ